MTTAPSSQAGSRVLPNVAACGVSIAPLVPVLCAFAAGIITDRQLDPLETGTWLTLALASVTVAALSLRGERSSSVFLLVAIVGLGGAWHHHRWSDLSPDDVSPGVSETPQPAWVRGVIAEYMGTRTSEGYAPGDPARIVTRMVLEITEISDGSRWHCASGRTLLIAAGDRCMVQGRVVPAIVLWLTGRLIFSQPIRTIWWSQLRKPKTKMANPITEKA